MQKLASIFATKNVEISGAWNGVYGYSDQYPEVYWGKEVQFIAFTGTIKESEEGIPEVSRIEGEVRGRKIAFIKMYEKMYLMEETGNTIIQDSPQYIRYEGVYDESTHAFCGEWRIETDYMLENGRERQQVNTGYWEMRNN